MGNQARVAEKSTVVSTSTRNFPNRLGKGANVYLASAEQLPDYMSAADMVDINEEAYDSLGPAMKAELLKMKKEIEGRKRSKRDY